MTINRIDMEEITARVDELREARDEYNEKMADPEAWARIDDGEPEELAELEELLEELPLELPDELLPLLLVSFLVEGALAAFFALEEFIMVSVTPPTFPSAVRPARFWNARTASSVISPKYPVAFALDR